MKMLWRILGLMRDLVKGLYRFGLQLVARLFYVEREWPSAISWSAVLDVIPRSPHERRNRLVVGKRSCIERWTAINTGCGSVFLGAHSGIGIGSIVIGPVNIGERTQIAQNCLISGQSHQYDDVSTIISQQGFDVREVVIEDNVWIAADCVVLPGVRIGRHSVIGAGSVVTKDIPAFSVAVGNPAKTVKKYDQNKNEWIKA